MNYLGTLRRKIVIPPLLSIKYFFSYQKFSETAQKGSPMKFFGTVRQKIFDGKSWYPPSFIHNFFFATGLFLKHGSEGFHYEIFRHCEKKILTENRDNPPPPRLIHNFFRYHKFCETKKGSPTKFFGIVRQQISKTKSWYSPLRHKVFRDPKFSETQSGSSTKFFGTVRRKFFDGN